LPEHAILLADGLPAESWLNTGDRSNLGDAIRVLPDFLTPPPNPAMLWESRGCAPFIVTGPKLVKARMLVAVRATAMTGEGQAPCEGIQFCLSGHHCLNSKQ
jgi:collagen type I/II/III/V/XI/XXIV/XXVII alpha